MLLFLVILNGSTTLLPPVLLLVCMVLRCWGANNNKDSIEEEDKKTGDLRVLVMIVLAVAVLATVTNIRLLWILTEDWKLDYMNYYRA
jgi:hypothetical protein